MLKVGVETICARERGWDCLTHPEIELLLEWDVSMRLVLWWRKGKPGQAICQIERSYEYAKKHVENALKKGWPSAYIEEVWS